VSSPADRRQACANDKNNDKNENKNKTWEELP